MTLADTLIEKASDYLPADKVEVVANAFHFAEKAHEGQKRLSGEPFVDHPLHTALFLADLRLDSNALAAALLHDVMEDCDVAYDELSAQEVKPQEDLDLAIPSIGPLTGIEVLGVGDLLTRMGRCCSPIRGDDIMGYITRNRGVTVHLTSCANVTNESESDRLVEVSWGKTSTLYTVRLRAEAWDRIGLLSDITAVVSAEKVNIASCVSEEDDDVAIVSLTVFVNGIDQLNRLCLKLEGVMGVMHVLWANNGGVAPVSQSGSAGQATNLS